MSIFEKHSLTQHRSVRHGIWHDLLFPGNQHSLSRVSHQTHRHVFANACAEPFVVTCEGMAILSDATRMLGEPHVIQREDGKITALDRHPWYSGMIQRTEKQHVSHGQQHVTQVEGHDDPVMEHLAGSIPWMQIPKMQQSLQMLEGCAEKQYFCGGVSPEDAASHLSTELNSVGSEDVVSHLSTELTSVGSFGYWHAFAGHGLPFLTDVASHEQAMLDFPDPSIGSIGHPSKCQDACKYVCRPRECKDGKGCSRCHLCRWLRQRTRKKTLVFRL
eukprot:TRINITY_DN30833_c0_g1_i2.p1 TRINITY_DN30833_c0_g1~~TRINITY_DN30833_c0_g1_i2.p1  ORF type:complete len:274 (+),score=40.83 TRINITY_DN30833_c0_g1_i2:72-893(+)